MSMRSEIDLPDFGLEQTGYGGIEIRFGSVGPPEGETYAADVPHCRSWLADSGIVIEWEDAGRFLVRGGREIIIDAPSTAPLEHVKLIVSGPAMAILLQQRDYLVLHGSAVGIDGAAAVFIGGKGFGKSTLAAALHARGHGVLSDDVIAVDLTDSANPKIAATFTQVKLWPDAVEAVGLDLNDLPRLSEAIEKRELRAGSPITGALPLRGIYSLGLGPAVAALPMSMGEALVDIVRNTYISRFGAGIAAPGQADRFRSTASLISAVPVFRFERENNLRLIADSAVYIERHVNSL